MSEQELREGLRLAVAGEPALAFDPDVLMARAKQEIRRRRALFGAGAATAAVAVAAVALPTLLGSPRGGGNQAGFGAGSPADQCAPEQVPSPEPPAFTIPAQPGISTRVEITEPPGKPTDLVVPEETGTPAPTPSAPPEPTSTPCQLSGEPPATPVPPTASGTDTPPAPDVPWPPPGATAKHYTAAELKDRGVAMSKELVAVFTKTVPAATGVSVDKFGGEATGAVSDGQNYLETFVHYSVKDVRSAVDIAVFGPGGGLSPAEACAEGSCSVRTGKDGTRFVVTTIAPEGKAEIMSVSHYRADGTVVRASGYNYDPTARDGSMAPTTMPVTVEQLMALASDPELHL